METEQLKHFLEDASFLEENKFQIDCKLHALEEEKEKGRTKVVYHLSNQKREYSLFVSSFFFLPIYYCSGIGSFHYRSAHLFFVFCYILFKLYHV